MDKQSLMHKTHVIANHTGLPFNTVLTHFFLEVLLSRIAASEGNKNLISKGGFLLSNILGIKVRTTVDIDFLITGMDMSVPSISAFIIRAINYPVIPEMICELHSIQQIREGDPYGGFRAKILCKLENIRQIVPLDIATGDPMTPGAIQYKYIPLFLDQSIQLKSYNVETILAEKLETVYRRGLVNSRCKDFYDIHVIWKLKGDWIDIKVFKAAFNNTCNYRHTMVDKQVFNELVELMKTDDQMVNRWHTYVSRNLYAEKISFDETLNTLRGIIQVLFN